MINEHDNIYIDKPEWKEVVDRRAVWEFVSSLNEDQVKGFSQLFSVLDKVESSIW